MSDSTIGTALKARRTELGLDQRDAAKRIDMSRTTYSSYERDTQRPSVDVLPAIAHFLEVSIDDILVLFGASAIAAARAALGRLSSGNAESPHAIESAGLISDEAAFNEGVTAHVFDTPDSADTLDRADTIDRADSRYDVDVPDTSPYAVSTHVASGPDGKIDAEREKSKKKKKKKGKREKLVTPAFATHV
jgi:transcriptional regulator with XRE-family HTH domain